MMDIQKEFKDYALSKGWCIDGESTKSGYLFYNAQTNDRWIGWQAAKSQAVPEGFMLVKKRNVIGNPKVDWLQAPKWAKYWLKDGYSNKFLWCSNRPKLEEDYFLFHGIYSAEEAPSFGFNGDWKKSMTSRKAMLEAQEQSHE